MLCFYYNNNLFATNASLVHKKFDTIDTLLSNRIGGEVEQSTLNKLVILNSEIEGLIKGDKTIVNNKSDKGNEEPVLSRAAFNGLEKTVHTLLIREGIDVDAKDKKGNTALIRASLGSHYKIVELILNKGASTAIKNQMGYTALMTAKQFDNQNIINILKKYEKIQFIRKASFILLITFLVALSVVGIYYYTQERTSEDEVNA